MNSPAPISPTSLELPLGFKGTVRIKALPAIRVTLEPSNPAVAITDLKPELALGGKCDNVRDSLACTLTWLWAPGGLANPAEAKPLAHSDTVYIVPKSTTGKLLGKAFDLKVKKNGQLVPLTLDVLRLGLYGKGRLGYELASGLPDTAPWVLPPDQSQLTVDLEAGLEILDLNDAPVSPAFKVGSQYRVRPKFARAFAGKRVRIFIQEKGTGYSGEKGKQHQLADRELGAAASAIDLTVGFDGGEINYRTTVDTLHYGYSIAFLSDDKKKNDLDRNAKTVDGDLLSVPKPQLAGLSIAFKPFEQLMSQLDIPLLRTPWPTTFDIQGQFDGFVRKQWTDHGTQVDFSLAVTVELFAHYHQVSGTKDSPKVQAIPLEPSFMHVHGNELSGTLSLHSLSQDEWARLAALEDAGLGVFAVLRLPPELGTRASKTRKGQPAQPLIFADVIGFAANDLAHPMAGMSAFGASAITGKALGTGVCSNLVDLKGQCLALGYEVGLDTDWPNWDPPNQKKFAHQNDYNDLIQQWADYANFDALTYKAMIAKESAFESRAHNAYGYAGLTQVGPSEARGAGQSIGGTSKASGQWNFDFANDDRFRPAVSIELGAIVLKAKADAVDKMIARQGYTVNASDRVKLIVAAYNIGEGTIRDACAELAKTTKTMTWSGICGTVDASAPLWKGIEKNPSVLGSHFTVQKKYEENSGYVKWISARSGL